MIRKRLSGFFPGRKISPSKFRTFQLGDRQVTIEGVSETDPYLAAMGNGVEDTIFNFCKRYLRPDCIAIDVGANIGITAALMSQCLPRGHVYAFEPSKTVFPVLVRNVAANRMGNVSVHEAALSDKAGVSYFRDQSAYGHLTDNLPGSHEVITTTCDGFAASHNLPSLGFLKIDVEGYEQSVLDGAIAVIGKFDPLIYMEFNSWCLISHSRTNPLTFLEWILDNFKEVHVVDKASPTFLRKVDRGSASNFLHRNMTLNGFVDDLVITNNAARLVPRVA